VGVLAHVVGPLLGMDSRRLEQYVNQRVGGRTQATAKDKPGVLLLKQGISPGEWLSIQGALNGETFGLNTNRLPSRKRRLLRTFRRWTLFAVDDQRRYLPYDSSLAQVLGFVGTGTNGHLLQGKWGLEAYLDDILSGRNGLCASSQDAAGNELAFCRSTDLAAADGARVVLTIDLPLQRIVEQALARALSCWKPSNASCVVIRPATGEILAMATAPAFCPQQPGGSPAATWRNRVISDRNEVGSVFKVITLATALDRGVVNLDQPIFCENGRWVYKRTSLRDDDHHYGILSVRECLVKSSNIGFAKIGLMVGTNGLYDSIIKFGFNQPTGLPLPYETAGFIRPPADWSAISITRLAIGHELAVSQMELAMAYAAIANDGRLLRPMLVRQVDHSDGTLWARYEPRMVRAVVQPETARQVRQVMREVVEQGTGKLAALPGNSAAGKTGTAQKSDGHRYLPGRLYCSFVGMLPADRPELVIAVAVDEPANAGYGGTVAAPVFREIAEQAVALYNIPQDKNPGLLPAPFPIRRRNSDPGMVALGQ